MHHKATITFVNWLPTGTHCDDTHRYSPKWYAKYHSAK